MPDIMHASTMRPTVQSSSHCQWHCKVVVDAYVQSYSTLDSSTCDPRSPLAWTAKPARTAKTASMLDLLDTIPDLRGQRKKVVLKQAWLISRRLYMLQSHCTLVAHKASNTIKIRG